MTTYHSRVMNIPRHSAGIVDATCIDSFERGHRRGHADAKHAAADIAGEADAEIARLQAQVAESQQQSDALLSRGLDYCDKIDALQAQVDALAGALQAQDALSKKGLIKAEYGEIERVGKLRKDALAAAGR